VKLKHKSKMVLSTYQGGVKMKMILYYTFKGEMNMVNGKPKKPHKKYKGQDGSLQP
jgi:hypothetical protein